jgi:hypothetical protein
MFTWRVSSSGIWRPVVRRVVPDVSEERIVSIFRVFSTCLPPACSLVCWTILRPWRWRQYVPPKRRVQLYGLHGVISQKMIHFKTIAVKTSNPTCLHEIMEWCIFICTYSKITLLCVWVVTNDVLQYYVCEVPKTGHFSAQLQLFFYTVCPTRIVFWRRSFSDSKNLGTLNVSNHREKKKYFLKFQRRFFYKLLCVYKIEHSL